MYCCHLLQASCTVVIYCKHLVIFRYFRAELCLHLLGQVTIMSCASGGVYHSINFKIYAVAI